MTRIDAQAAIYFDLNEPIETPPIFNTVGYQTSSFEIVSLYHL